MALLMMSQTGVQSEAPMKNADSSAPLLKQKNLDWDLHLTLGPTQTNLGNIGRGGSSITPGLDCVSQPAEHRQNSTDYKCERQPSLGTSSIH